MGSLMLRDQAIARKKGFFALGALGGSALLFSAGAPVLGVFALGGAGYLAYNWFMFRAKRGMRF